MVSKNHEEQVSAIDPTLNNTYATVLPTTDAGTTLYNSTNIEVNTATKLVTGGVAPNIWSGATWGQFLTDTKAKGGWYYNFDHNTSTKIMKEMSVRQPCLETCSPLPHTCHLMMSV